MAECPNPEKCPSMIFSRLKNGQLECIVCKTVFTDPDEPKKNTNEEIFADAIAMEMRERFEFGESLKQKDNNVKEQ